MGISGNAERRDDSPMINPCQLVKDANALQVDIALAKAGSESVARHDLGYGSRPSRQLLANIVKATRSVGCILRKRIE